MPPRLSHRYLSSPPQPHSSPPPNAYAPPPPSPPPPNPKSTFSRFNGSDPADSYHAIYRDAAGGVSHLSYNVTFPDDLVSLDYDENVLDVKCPGPDIMTLTVARMAPVLAWVSTNGSNNGSATKARALAMGTDVHR